jgi:hypothetical protein
LEGDFPAPGGIGAEFGADYSQQGVECNRRPDGGAVTGE